MSKARKAHPSAPDNQVPNSCLLKLTVGCNWKREEDLSNVSSRLSVQSIMRLPGLPARDHRAHSDISLSSLPILHLLALQIENLLLC
jgi:hypothetical protein